MPSSRHTLRMWEEDATSFLCDITDQTPMRNLDGTVDNLLCDSKLERDESKRMLRELAAALGCDWGQMIHSLAKAWRVRRELKAAMYGWFDEDEERAAAARAARKKARRRNLGSAMRPGGKR